MGRDSAAATSLYWARFFNVPIYGLLIWLAYIFVKQLFPANTFSASGRSAAPGFLSARHLLFDQQRRALGASGDANDVLGSSHVSRRGPSPGLALAAGLSAAAALLTKYTNAPVLVLVGILAVFTFRKFSRTPRSAAGLAAAVLLLLTFCLPVGCWLARNYFRSRRSGRHGRRAPLLGLEA